MRRIRQLGMFQGLELDSEELGQLPSIPLGFPDVIKPQVPAAEDPCFDPLSDPLDEPFPEELE